MRDGAYARTDDPDTSHMAADRVDVQKMEGIVISHLWSVYPRSRTVIEIANAVGEHPWSISPRMKPLEKKNLVERDGKRTAINSKGKASKQIVWKAVVHKPKEKAQLDLI